MNNTNGVVVFGDSHLVEAGLNVDSIWLRCCIEVVVVDEGELGVDHLHVRVLDLGFDNESFDHGVLVDFEEPLWVSLPSFGKLVVN